MNAFHEFKFRDLKSGPDVANPVKIWYDTKWSLETACSRLGSLGGI